MVSVLASSAVDRGFEPRSGKTKDYENDNCCFSDKALRRKSKDWLARNQNNVSEWSDMSIRGLFFSVSAYWSRTKRTSSSSHWKLTCCRHDIHLKNCWICAKQQPLNRSVCSCIAFNYTFGIYKLFLILVFIIIYFRYLSKSLKWLCDTYVCIYIYIYIYLNCWICIITEGMPLIYTYIYRFYICVWKLRQTVLELDLWAVKFLFFPRRDLNSHHWYTAPPFAKPYVQRPRPHPLP